MKNKKEFTIEERHEIYKLAYEKFKNNSSTLCFCIEYSVCELYPELTKYFVDLGYEKMIPKHFPEMVRIKPANRRYGEQWWHKKEFGNYLSYAIRRQMFETIINYTKPINHGK